MRWLPMVNSTLLPPPMKSGAPGPVSGGMPVFSSTVQASVRCFTVSVFTWVSLL